MFAVFICSKESPLKEAVYHGKPFEIKLIQLQTG